MKRDPSVIRPSQAVVLEDFGDRLLHAVEAGKHGEALGDDDAYHIIGSAGRVSRMLNVLGGDVKDEVIFALDACNTLRQNGTIPQPESRPIKLERLEKALLDRVDEVDREATNALNDQTYAFWSSERPPTILLNTPEVDVEGAAYKVWSALCSIDLAICTHMHASESNYLNCAASAVVAEELIEKTAPLLTGLSFLARCWMREMGVLESGDHPCPSHRMWHALQSSLQLDVVEGERQ